MQIKNSLFKVLFYSILLLLFGELTKYGSIFIAISFLLCSVFIFLVKRINLVEIFSILIILSAYGQILRGANGFVTYISLIFATTLLFRLKSFKFKLPWIFIFIIFSQLVTLLYFQNNLFSSFGGFLSLLGIFSSVLFIRNINWNKNNIIFILKVFCLLPFLNIIIIVTDVIGLDIPLFFFSDNVNQKSDFLDLNKYGTFGSSELMGEAMMICSIISLNLLNNTKNSTETLFLLFSFIFSLILVILAFSRSIILLTLFFLLISFLHNRTIIFNKRTFAILFSFFLIWNISLNQNHLLKKFTNNSVFLQTFFDNPFRAVNTSREYVFQLAFDKINSKPYVFGDGYRLPEENKKTWLGKESENWADYHNLYYSIIPIFGWVILFLFLFLFFLLLKNYFKLLFFSQSNSKSINNIYLVFFMITMAFAIGQFKINGLRTGSYFYFLFSFLYLMFYYSLSHSKKINA